MAKNLIVLAKPTQCTTTYSGALTLTLNLNLALILTLTLSLSEMLESGEILPHPQPEDNGCSSVDALGEPLVRGDGAMSKNALKKQVVNLDLELRLCLGLRLGL